MFQWRRADSRRRNSRDLERTDRRFLVAVVEVRSPDPADRRPGSCCDRPEPSNLQRTHRTAQLGRNPGADRRCRAVSSGVWRLSWARRSASPRRPHSRNSARRVRSSAPRAPTSPPSPLTSRPATSNGPWCGTCAGVPRGLASAASALTCRSSGFRCPGSAQSRWVRPSRGLHDPPTCFRPGHWGTGHWVTSLVRRRSPGGPARCCPSGARSALRGRVAWRGHVPSRPEAVRGR